MNKNIIEQKISSVDNNTGLAVLESTTSRGTKTPNVIIPQPYVGRGWGIRAGIEIDSTILTMDSINGKTHILGFLPEQKYFRRPTEPGDSSTRNSPTFKHLNEGEIAIQSIANSLIFLNEDGNISINTADGTAISIDNATDSINQISVSSYSITEAAKIVSGVVRRDIRTDQEKLDELFLGSLIRYNFSEIENMDIIGVDRSHKIPDIETPLVGIFDSTDGSPSILKLPGLSDVPQANKIMNIVNPALTEYRIEINEFSDGIAGLAPVQLEDAQLRSGFLPLNMAGRFLIGTNVNNKGRTPRFDYVFSSPKGHGDIWKLPGVNDKQQSVDFKIDPLKNIKTIESPGDKTQWVVNSIDSFNTATAFQLLLNTRGADNKGIIPGRTPGSTWGLQVDKEGLTKWNIPASTSLGGREAFRIGRSLLWNLDGSYTLSVGMENNPDLSSITSKRKETSFVNMLTTRRKRSLTEDYEGAIETRIGSDTAGQSQMIEADGSLAFYYGRAIGSESSVVSNISTAGLESPSRSGTRIGTSISGRTEGSIELDVGVNTEQSRQSVALHTSGMIQLAIGEDKVKDSLKIEAAGNIKLKTVNGGHKFEMFSNQATGSFKNGIRIQHGGLQQSLFQIDQNGVITIRNSLANSNFIMSQTGDMTMINATGTKISLSTDGSIGIGNSLSGIDISPTAGVVLRTAGGSISLSTAGKVEIAANLGFTVTSIQAHLNSTGILFGPGAATSPYRVAVTGSGLGIDPLSGHSSTGFSLLGAIG